MSLQYSGGTLVNNTFTATTRADLVNNITSACSSAGWGTISGTPGSGADVTLETAAQNAGAKVRFRFFDPAANNCAQITMKHPSGTPTSAICYLLPTAGTGLWRVIANKFFFYAFPSGSGAIPTAARGAIMGGTIYTFSMSNTDGICIGMVMGSGTSDTDASTHITWRRCVQPSSSAPLWSVLNGSTLVETISTSVSAGEPSIAVWQGGRTSQDEGYRWEDGTYPVYEALVAWATGSAIGNEPMIKGQLYDACVLNGSRTGEGTVSLDGHTWLILTDTPTGNVGRTAQLILAVT
jgi:hypothetical protein